MSKSAILGCSALALLFAGCGESDGSKELADGWAAHELHDLKKAERLFDKSVACNGENVDALVASARVKLELGEIAAARDVLARAAARAGTDADVILLGAQLAYHAKDYKQAAEAYLAFAKDPARELKLRADAYVGLAVVEMTCNEREKARVALLKALVLDRRSAAARYHLGKLYSDEHPEAALEMFEAYVMLDPVADLRAQRVQRQTIPALKEVIAHKAMEVPGAAKRDSTTAARKLQAAEAEVKKGSAAKALYAEALKADPLSYPAALGLAQMSERTATAKGGRAETLSCYQAACRLKPTATKPLMATARLAVALGRNATAQEAYSRALVADPKNLEALDGMIRLMKKTDAKTAALWQSYRDMLKK